MFDVGFFELLVIGVVTLLVVGPERLPKVARTAGMWLGRGRRFVRSVKQDIEAEIKADELREIIEKQKIDNPLHEIIEDTRQDLEEIRSGTESAMRIESPAKPDARPAADAKPVPDASSDAGPNAGPGVKPDGRKDG